MTDPPAAKRSRRTDSATMWDNADGDRQKVGDRRGPEPDRKSKRRRSRSRTRSRSRDRKDNRRNDRGGRRRDVGGDRSRSRSREQGDEPRNERPNRKRQERGSPRRSRSPAPHGDNSRGQRRTRSPPRPSRAPGDHVNGSGAGSKVKKEPDTMEGIEKTKAAKPHVEDEDAESAMMRRMMGFAGFRSTKQTKVPGNDWYAVRKEKKTEYRQYMNRQGGFNRPLSPSR